MSLEHLPVEVTPEVELLLACASTQAEGATIERIKRLAQPDLDWPALLALAKQHLLEPLLYWNLNRFCPEAVPPTSLDQLRRRYRLTARHNFYMTRELVKLLKLLVAHNIPAIPYKGPILAVTGYHNLALRQFGDLDIIIRRQDFVTAKQLLLSQDFYPLFVRNERQEKIYLQSNFHYDYHFFRETDRMKVELHWRLNSSCTVDLEQVWQRLEPVSFAGLTIDHFCPEDLLLVLAMHGAKHRWRYVRLVCDVAELIGHQPALDWDQALDQAKNVGELQVLLWSLYLAHTLLNTSLPPEVWRSVQHNQGLRDLTIQVYHRQFYAVEGRPGIIDTFYLKPSRREKLRYLAELIRWGTTPEFNDPAWDQSWARFLLAVILRPVRLTGEAGASVKKICRARLSNKIP